MKNYIHHGTRLYRLTIFCFLSWAFLLTWFASLIGACAAPRELPTTDANGHAASRVVHVSPHLIDADAILGWALQQPPTLVRYFSQNERRRRKKLGGRLDRKSKIKRDWGSDWTHRAFDKLVFVYMRFSTYEQKKNHRYSLERQENLKRLAIQQGAKAELSTQEVEQLKSAPDYPGWYRDGQIIVEERDLVGVSGTKGQEDRPGLAHLIALIEQGLVSVVYVVDITRLFRDQYLINATQFVKLGAEAGIVVATEGMCFDLTNDMHCEMFLEQAKYASRELRVIVDRMAGSRKAKAQLGKYVGAPVAAGYIVLPDEHDRLSDFAIYEPQAEIVRLIFSKFLETRCIQTVALWLNRNNILMPTFGPELSYMLTRSAVNKMLPVRGPDGEVIGYQILRTAVQKILVNPTYMGHIYRTGELVKVDPSLAIVTEETFLAVQAILEQNQPQSRGGHVTQLLAGLLYCTAHGEEPYLIYCSEYKYMCLYEQRSGLADRACFTVDKDVLNIPITQVVLGVLSFADRAEQIIKQLEDELKDRQGRAQTYQRERKRLESERDSLVESLAFLHEREKDPQRRKVLMEEVYHKIDERQARLEELSRQELAPFEDVLTTTEVEMVREFLGNLGTRWDTIPVEMRNAFLHVILDRILVQPAYDHFDVRINWRSGFEQHIIIFRPSITMPKLYWSEAEDAIIREHYPTALPADLMRLLPGRLWEQIGRRATKLGLKRDPNCRPEGNKRPWSPEEDQALRDYDECRISYLEMRAALSDRHPAALHQRAWKLGIDLGKRRIMWRFATSEVNDERGSERLNTFPLFTPGTIIPYMESKEAEPKGSVSRSG